MALTLTCTCGAHFEVPDSYAGQTVNCPECHAVLQAVPSAPSPIRTSGFALASVFFALVTACTGVGTILAVILGLIALAHIAVNRDRFAGKGYAWFGITTGLICTGLFLFAVIKGELFGADERVREHFKSQQVDRSGDLEIRRPDDGFAITRPSRSWGVAKRELAQELADDADLVLVHPGKDANIAVNSEDLGRRTFEAYRDEIVDKYRKPADDEFPFGKPKKVAKDFQLRQNQRLPSENGLEMAEVLLDVRRDGQLNTYLIRIIHVSNERDVFTVTGWTSKRRFPRAEAEIRQALTSLRVLRRD